MSPRGKLPRLIVSTRTWLGAATAGPNRLEGGESSAPADQVVRFRARLRAAAQAGAGGLLTLGETSVLRALESAGVDLAVLPVIPNVPGYVRDATEYGLAGAGLRRFRRVGLLGSIRLGLFGVPRVLKVLQRDFPTLLAIMCELEMNEFRRYRPPAVFLHGQVTDLMLSFENRRALALFADLIRTRYGAEPGLVTSNFARLASRLDEWNLPIALVAAPVNRIGYLMPEHEGERGIASYRQATRDGRFRIVADRISAESPTPTEDIDWALAQSGVVAALVDQGDQAAQPGSPGMLR